MFKFVRIPSNHNEPVEECQEDKSGGLTNDNLIRHVKEYFGEQSKKKQSGGKKKELDAVTIDALSPADRTRLAQSMRQQIGKQQQHLSKNAGQMDDDTLIEIYKAATLSDKGSDGSGSCDIVALTVPKSKNNFEAVSMYVSQDVEESPKNVNERAMAVMKGCGHGTDKRMLYGDVFVGRCHDDEAAGKEWQRLDLSVSEIDADSAWCKTARSPGGGGGSGKAGASAPSLGGSLTQALGQQTAQHYTPTATPLLEGEEHVVEACNDGDDKSSPYTWSQRADEVEIKFQLPSDIKSKDVKVVFKHDSLKVTVAGDPVLAQSSLCDTIIVDESTYTLQSIASSGKKELCLTLAKRKTDTPWVSVVVPK